MKTFNLAVLNTNLFPTTTKPLVLSTSVHIYMVKQAIMDQAAVALSFYLPEDTHYRKIAGYGFPYLAGTKQDGSILVYIQGQGKVDLSTAMPLPSADITYIDVDPVKEQLHLTENEHFKYVALSKYFALWIDKYLSDPAQKDFFLKSLKGAHEVVSACAAYLVKDFEIQYELMEIFDINQQVDYLYRLLISNQLIR